MNGPRTLGELAAAEQVRPPTMSRLVREMQRAGVARKVTDRKDKRVVRVHATAKGLRALERGRAMRIAAIEALLERVGEADVAAVERAVAVIEEMLGARAAPWRSRPKAK